jgi:hypothetical protein
MKIVFKSYQQLLQPRIAVAETQGQFWKLIEVELTPLEAVTRGLVKIQQTKKTTSLP